jgi:carboxymethylenebutenolidase
MTTRQTLPSGLPINIAGDSAGPQAIIVLQEAFGVNDHIREVTDRFAAAGYFAVAPELFHRDGSPEIAYDDFAAALTHMGNFTRAGLEGDVRDTVEFLGTLGIQIPSIGIVGYCMGGTVATFVDTLGIVGAAVSFYGGGVTNGRFGLPSLVELAPAIKAPWLGLFGGLDKGIPMDQVDALDEAMSDADAVTEVVIYDEADHGFHCDNRTNVYDDEAAFDAANRTLEFFSEHLR